MPVMVTKHPSYEKLVKVLPRQFIKLAAGLSLEGPVVLVLFTDEVVTSGKVRKAFRKIASGEQQSLLLVGRDFTEEARKFAAEHDAPLLSETPFGWTDSAYEKIRIDRGASVKGPDWT